MKRAQSFLTLLRPKFCTFINLPWADEYINISTAYNSFDVWVTTGRPATWWEENIESIVSEQYTNLDLSDN